jgi:iron transport multicopper oxidase
LDELFSPNNTAMRPPRPSSGLINGKGGKTVEKFKFVAGRTYKFRLINMSALTNAIIYFDQHIMTIVEIDGVYTQPTEAGQIYIAAGQRYAFLVKAKETAERNYAFQVVFDTNPSLSLPIIGYTMNNTGYLLYKEDGELPTPPLIQKFDVIDDTTIAVCFKCGGLPMQSTGVGLTDNILAV